MYKLIKSPFDGEIRTVNKQDGNMLLSIPFVPDNTDYANFKKEVLAGAELQDADGNVMTDAAEYVRTLP
jgi:hypothetical protein